MPSTDFSHLSQFVRYANQRFDLWLLAGRFSDGRSEPRIPARSVWLSLVLGEVIGESALSQIGRETQLPQWQRWVGYRGCISHDTLGYAAERYDPAHLRRGLGWINRKLKRGKAFEASKLNGLLLVSLDANEQFCSDHRCCQECLSRQIQYKDSEGQQRERTQYYHKQVYAQLSGPQLSVILDFEPMRQGEEECSAALRLLRRMREQYGPRFFDVAVVDAWYANGPFLKTVVEELGWPVVAVLKQECREAYQEVMALTQRQAPTLEVERGERRVAIWEVKDVRFTDSYPGPVRLIRGWKPGRSVNGSAGSGRGWRSSNTGSGWSPGIWTGMAPR